MLSGAVLSCVLLSGSLSPHQAAPAILLSLPYNTSQQAVLSLTRSAADYKYFSLYKDHLHLPVMSRLD